MGWRSIMAANTIFIIEDQPEVCEALTTVLTPEGFDIYSYAEPEELLDGLKQNTPGIVIADFYLRGMDASGLIKTLQRMHVPCQIVLMSGICNLPEKAKELGVNYWVQKPFELNHLLNLLRWLRMQSQIESYSD
jgi:FixJ family two-component response regulator